LGAAVINGSGTGTLRKSQLSEALSGSSVQYRFEVGEESFTLQGSTVSSEIELLLQVLHSLIQDPGFREDAYRTAMQDFESMYGRLEHSVAGNAHLYLDSFFTGDAPGSGMGSWDQMKSIELQQVVDWLAPYFSGAPLELSIVGDIDPEKVQRLASIYFAGLPERSNTDKEAGRAASNAAGARSSQAVFPVGERLDITVDAPVDKALVRVGWLTDDFWDISRTRRLHVLAAVFEERLRRVIREELGTSYSPSAYATASRIYPDYGAVYAEVVVEVAALDKVLQAIEKIADSLVNDPVDESELARSREPIITSLKDSFRTNGYWLYSVLSLSSRHEEQLIWPLSMISDFSSVSAEEIKQMAETYIRDERRGVGVISSNGLDQELASKAAF
jgi:zinc protease